MPRPDDGLIHAWLDGQLPPEEAARIEALVAADPEWAAAVAEARGVVAASTRILSALDQVPAGVVPRGTAGGTAARTGQRLPWWTKIAAAVVVVAGGSIVVIKNTPDERMSAPATPVPALSPVATARVPADAPTATALVAEEQRVVQDAGRAAADVSAAKSLEATAARKVAPTVAPTVAPAAVPTAERQAQQTAGLGFAQAQNTVPAQRAVAGGSAAQDARQQREESFCYRLVPDSANAGVAVVMRAVRTDGDTLRLVPVEPNVPARAWIMRRDGVWHGAAVSLPAGRDTVPVVASRVACPAP